MITNKIKKIPTEEIGVNNNNNNDDDDDNDTIIEFSTSMKASNRRALDIILSDHNIDRIDKITQPIKSTYNKYSSCLLVSCVSILVPCFLLAISIKITNFLIDTGRINFQNNSTTNSTI